MEQMFWQPFTAEARKKQIQGHPLFMTTYRKGTKWLRPELVGQVVAFVDEKDNSKFAEAEVVSVKAVRFCDIPPEDHALQSSEMSPEARLGVMQKVYGEYDNQTLTTVVTLKVL